MQLPVMGKIGGPCRHHGATAGAQANHTTVDRKTPSPTPWNNGGKRGLLNEFYDLGPVAVNVSRDEGRSDTRQSLPNTPARRPEMAPKHAPIISEMIATTPGLPRLSDETSSKTGPPRRKSPAVVA